MEISLASINNPPSRELFRQPSQITGLLIEGIFTSVFKNRMTESFGLNFTEVKTESDPTRMIVFSDGDLMTNDYRIVGNKPEFRPLGFDRYSQQIFGNKSLLLNAVNYLCDDEGLMELRSRSFKIRLLDKVKIKEHKLFWQLLNVLAPLLLVAVGGSVYLNFRRRRFKC
jgi:ABC-2 type transport system permease protein